MTLTEIVEQVSDISGLSKADTRCVINEALRIIKEAALKDEPVSLLGFGKFSKKVYPPKTAFGRITSEKTTIKFSPYDSVAVREGDKNGKARRSPSR